MPLTKVIDPDPARHNWFDLAQVVSCRYLPGTRPPWLELVLSSGGLVRLTDPAQVADVAKTLGITLPS
jgi:hypothetical protein